MATGDSMESRVFGVFENTGVELTDVARSLADSFGGAMVFLDAVQSTPSHRFSYLCLALHGIIRYGIGGCGVDGVAQATDFFATLERRVVSRPSTDLPAFLKDAGFAKASLLTGGLVGFMGYGVCRETVAKSRRLSRGDRSNTHGSGERDGVSDSVAPDAWMARPAVILCKDSVTGNIALSLDAQVCAIPDAMTLVMTTLRNAYTRRDSSRHRASSLPAAGGLDRDACMPREANRDGGRVPPGRPASACRGCAQQRGADSLEPDLPEGWHADMTRDEYCRAVEYVKAQEREGNAYVVNLTQRIHGPRCDDPWRAYLRLRTITPAPYSAYLEYGNGVALCCSSMERFLMIRDGKAVTSPIKGTSARGENPESDAASRDALMHSAKDRAELLMVVDLERNDMSRLCLPESITVPALARVETYSTLHQLVCDVMGTLAGPTVAGAVRLLRDMFPGGSVTGAPKESAMRIIDHVERSPRGAYTGCLGYLADGGDADFGIVIRTMECDACECRLGVGGGITHESDPRGEYDEMVLKSRAVIEAFLPHRRTPDGAGDAVSDAARRAGTGLEKHKGGETHGSGRGE